MRLNDCPVPVYGDQSFRGKCPKEEVEQITFFNRIRKEYPDTFGLIAIHPRNEQQLRGGQHAALSRHKASGMTKGASDIVIPGSPSFVCELKRRDHTKSAWQDGQKDYLKAASDAGAFACVALGVDAATEAFREWLNVQAKR